MARTVDIHPAGLVCCTLRMFMLAPCSRQDADRSGGLLVGYLWFGKRARAWRLLAAEQ